MVETADSKLEAQWAEKFKACSNQRTQYEKQWYTNMAFYFGRQWSSWVQANGLASGMMLVDPKAPPWRVRYVANKIKPYMRTELTKLTKEEPQFYVVPNTSEETDLAAARAGESITEHLMNVLHFNRVRRSATFWTVLCGTGFVKVWFDPAKEDKAAQPLPMGMEGPTGALTLESVSPFHLFVPYLQEEVLENQPYIIHARAVDPDIIKSVYGVSIEPDVKVQGDMFDSRFLNALGIKQKNDKTKQSYVKEYWVKPCKQFPDGAMFITANDKIIYMHEALEEVESNPLDLITGQTQSSYPYDHGLFPFLKLDHVPAGQFYAKSVIEDLIAPQKEYNRSRSQMQEAKNLMGKPQMTYVRGSLDPSKITAQPGLMIPVQPGFERPMPLSLPTIPSYVSEEMDRVLRDMDDLAGQYEITKGRTPPGVEAASAIAYLQEENDTRLYHTVASIEEATQGIGQQLLELVQQYWDIPRIVKVTSKNNYFEALQFKGSDLRGNTDLRIEAGSMAPRSRAARQAFITELMKMGMIPPEQGLKYLQLNETNRLYEEMQVDTRQAQRENFRLSQGMQLAPNDWDNDPVHIEQHERYMKGESFELLDPELQQLFIMHVAMHKQKVVMAQMQMQQMNPMDEDAEHENAPGDMEEDAAEQPGPMEEE